MYMIIANSNKFRLFLRSAKSKQVLTLLSLNEIVLYTIMKKIKQSYENY
jgi:hypothetical protein